MYNLGFAVFTVCSVLLSLTWIDGSAGALWLILMRLGQGIGGALLFANSTAILTDAFPRDQRGMALGVNSIAAIAGSFIGPRPGRRARPRRLAAGVPRLGALRPVRDRLGVPHATRDRRAAPGADRLVGQRDLRGRADRGPGRHHLRHPAVRRAHHGVDDAVRPRQPHRRARVPVRSSSWSEPRRGADVPTCRCSASAPSPPATWPPCWPPWAAAGCSSC